MPIETGLGLSGIIEAAIEGTLKAMYVVGDISKLAGGLSPYGEPTWTLEDIKSGLCKLDLLVVHDHYLTELGELAHVVLPRTGFAEKAGTFTNIERRVQLLNPAMHPPGESMSELWAVGEIGKRMGASGFDFETSAQVLDEIASLVPEYGGISHQRLEDDARPVFRPDPSNPLPTQVLYSSKEYRGLQWPCPSSDHEGTAELYSMGFPGGKPAMAEIEFRAVPPSLQDGSSLTYVPGRVLLQTQREASVQPGRQNQITREELAELNPEDAGVRGLKEGDPVEVRTSDRTFQARISLADGVPKGCISCTNLFGQLAIDTQASRDVDPMSKVPGLNIAEAVVTAEL